MCLIKKYFQMLCNSQLYKNHTLSLHFVIKYCTLCGHTHNLSSQSVVSLNALCILHTSLTASQLNLFAGTSFYVVPSRHSELEPSATGLLGNDATWEPNNTRCQLVIAPVLTICLCPFCAHTVHGDICSMQYMLSYSTRLCPTFRSLYPSVLLCVCV